MNTTRKSRPLGTDQKLALAALLRHGQWPGGWHLDNTRRVLESLVQRGLVTARVADPETPRALTIYTLTEQGRVASDAYALPSVTRQAILGAVAAEYDGVAVVTAPLSVLKSLTGRGLAEWKTLTLAGRTSDRVVLTDLGRTVAEVLAKGSTSR